MDPITVRTRVEADRQSISLEMSADDGPLGHVFLAGSDIEDFIQQLSRHRAELVDEVPRSLDVGSRVEAQIDPVWRLTHSADGPLLHLRHPGIGWLTFLFPEKEAEAIGRHLLAGRQQSHTK